MRHYSVYMPDQTPDGDRSLQARTTLAEFVKDGFSWPALVFGPLWLIWHRLWRELLAYAVVAALLALALNGPGFDPGLQFAAATVVAVFFGVMGNDLRRAALERRGYTESASLSGERLDDCEARFFAQLSADVPNSGGATA